MKKILHLSDLHFGTERPGIVNALQEEIHLQNPDIIIISGDFTQRAFISQYKRARAFLENLPHKNILCVPGNHDISLHNLFERFIYPYHRYRKFITSDLNPNLTQGNISIFGINSVTPFKRMSGYVTDQQLDQVKDFFKNKPAGTTRIIVMHHNLISSVRHKIINNAEKIISQFAESKINFVLSGHIHAPHLEWLQRNYLAHNMYIITAGSAISTRTIEPNSFNVIELDGNQLKLQVKTFNNAVFSTVDEKQVDM